MCFIEPAAVKETAVYEDEHLRVRVSLPKTSIDEDWPAAPLIAHVTVENKRNVLAHIDATRSCLIDPKEGALNLAVTDRILPAEGWARFSNMWQSLVTVNVNVLVTNTNEGKHIEPGDRQRILLHVKWADGAHRDVDLTYAVAEKQPPQVASAGEQPAGR